MRIDRHKGIKLPSSFEEILLDGKEETSRKLLREYSGHLVAIKDRHSGNYYHTGVLRTEDSDDEFYWVLRNEGTSKEHEQRYHYHDLEGFLVPKIV